jgi:hypothetical protein
MKVIMIRINLAGRASLDGGGDYAGDVTAASCTNFVHSLGTKQKAPECK